MKGGDADEVAAEVRAAANKNQLTADIIKTEHKIGRTTETQRVHFLRQLQRRQLMLKEQYQREQQQKQQLHQRQNAEQQQQLKQQQLKHKRREKLQPDFDMNMNSKKTEMIIIV